MLSSVDHKSTTLPEAGLGEVVTLHVRLTHHAEEVAETDCCELPPAYPLSQTRRDRRGRKDDRACIDSQIALVSLY